jgi:hypothetical protein
MNIAWNPQVLVLNTQNKSRFKPIPLPPWRGEKIPRIGKVIAAVN